MHESRIAVGPPAGIVAFLPILLAGVIHLGAVLVGQHAVVEWTKPLLMPALAVGLIWGAPQRRSPVIVLGVLASALSWLGDITLRWFIVGLAFFLLAHIAYLVLFVTRIAVRRLNRWALAYAAWLVVLLVLLVPHTGSLLVPVIAYGVVLSAMSAVASRCNPAVAWGGALFVISDSILAIDRFLPAADISVADFLIMVTYLAAQALIVWGLLRHERARLTRA